MLNQMTDVLPITTTVVPIAPLLNTEHFERYAGEMYAVMDKMSWRLVAQVGDEIVSVWRDRRSVFIFGNGGSSATAQHMAADLSKNTTKPGSRRLRAMCLSDNTALFTALSNDLGYERALADQIAIYANPGDLAIAISASGNSPNVLAGVACAQALGMRTIGMSGYEGGKLVECVASTIVVPCHDIEQIEDFHMILVHMLTSYVRSAICRELGMRPW